MMSKKVVKHVAKLARLGLTEKEITKFQKELSKILDYIEKLKEVEISKVEPTSHSILLKNVMRSDEVNSKVKIQESKLMDLVPEKKEGYVKVKSIFQ